MNLKVLYKKVHLTRTLTKTLLVMKLTIILLMGFLLNAHAEGNAQTITWSGKNVSLEKVFTVIKRQTGYFVFYNNDLLKDSHKISLDVKNVTLQDLLELCFRDQPLDYAIEQKTIVVIRKFNSTPEKQTAKDTSREVSGTIQNEKGEPITGASIVVAGTKIGASANANGRFSIQVPQERNELIISSVGYEDQVVAINRSTSIAVVLKNKITSGDDIVVIGYGSVRKSDVTGAVSSVSKKNLGDRQVSGIGQLIQGQAAGVDVSQNKIRIRGVTSFNNTDPLVVIDGFIGGNLATVNPNDIANIEILKDASSTAIYGSRGGNGVILITTISGKPGPLKFNLGYYEGISSVPRKLDLLNADQYTDYVLNLLSNSGMTPTDKFLSGETRVDRTDWQDEVFKNGHIRELNVDFSGGSDKANFFVGMGYRRDAFPTYMGRISDNFYVRNKNSFTIKKWIRAGNNFAFAYNSNHGGGNGNPGNLDWVIANPSYFPVRDAAGEFTVSDRNVDLIQLANNITVAHHNQIQGRNLDYQAALWAEVEPLKGLTYRIQAGVSGNFGTAEYARESYTGGDAGPSTLPTYLDKSSYSGFSPLIEQYITYKKTLGKHDFSAMVGNTWQDGARGGTIGVAGQGLDLAVRNVLTAPTNFVTQDRLSKNAYLSYFGRINYQFDNKYLLTLNLRTDGSPKFNPDNRWGTFYSVAGAWKLHEENFIKNLNFFDQLKIRGSWGLSGSDAIGDFMYLSRVYTQNVYAIFGPDGTRYNGATILNSSSNNIKWETVESKSIAAEMALLDNRLSFSVEYFDKQTRDILHKVPRAISLGYGSSGENGSAVVNAASLQNKGIELAIGYKSTIGQFGYSVNANYTHQTNKVTSLGDGTFIDGINRTDIGNPVGYFYGFVADGIFMNQKDLDAANSAAQAKGFDYYQLNTTRPGDVRFVDVNGDGRVDNDDRTKLGSPHPTNLFGMSINLDYKGFNLFALLQGQTGSEIFDGNYHRQRGMVEVLNQFTYVLDRWQSEDKPGNGIVPRAILGDPAQNNRTSSLRMTSGNYLKIRQLSLGYSFSNTLSKRMGVDNLRIYASAANFFTFSKWDYGFDPEVGGDNLERGRDGGNGWPAPKTLIFGFQVRL